MKKTYTIQGMTCGGCKTSVTKHLLDIEGVLNVDVHLEKETVNVEMNRNIGIEFLQQSLPEKFIISNTVNLLDRNEIPPSKDSKLKQLRPLFLIFLYLIVGIVIIHREDRIMTEAMLDFMGMFFLVFSFFKFLDLRGFSKSFTMYDPLAGVFSGYGMIYPFLELALGILILIRFEVTIALIVTIIILGITTIGVTRTLLLKRKIKCACLGTALNLPMTEATFIENAIMIVMAFSMLFGFL